LAEESTQLDLAHRLAEGLIEVVDCDQAHVFLWDSGEAMLSRVASAARRITPPPALGTRSVRDATVASHLLALSSPHVVSVASDPLGRAMLGIAGLASGVLVPITARNELFGALLVGLGELDPVPDDTTRERLAGVAGLAATALEGMTLLDEIRHQALHDPVTDLANSRLFEDRVTHALSASRRNPGTLGFLFVDLDRFKAVNDTHGHTVGDMLLREVAARLQSLLRDEDTVARIGGDEFGVLLPHAADLADVERVAEKIVVAMRQPFEVRGLRLSVGTSVGVTTFPEPGDTYDSIMSRADSAMYQAKAHGRGRYHTHEARGALIEGERRV
jgi:diguanylate cyclase (GGDEF)-like protein